jgi:hypothetical protein
MKISVVFLMFILFACKKDQATNQSAILLVAPANDSLIAVSWHRLQHKLSEEHTNTKSKYGGTSSLKELLSRLRYVPTPEKGEKYDWSVATNSAMAVITKNMFPNANDELITQLEIDNLEAFSNNCTQDEIIRSVNFGRQMAGSICQK